MVAIIEGVEAVTIHIRDVPAARRFYGEVLGLREMQYDEKAGRVVYALPGTSIALRMHVPSPDEGGRPPGTVSGVVFSHHDPRAACEEIRRRGGSIVNEPEELHPPGFRTTLAVFADPDGNEFVLRSPPVPSP